MQRKFKKVQHIWLRQKVYPVSSLKGRGPGNPGRSVMTVCDMAMPVMNSNVIQLMQLHEQEGADLSAIFSYSVAAQHSCI